MITLKPKKFTSKGYYYGMSPESLVNSDYKSKTLCLLLKRGWLPNVLVSLTNSPLSVFQYLLASFTSQISKLKKQSVKTGI